MNITVNGTTQPMSPDGSLIALLAEIVGDCTDGVAVALNLEVVRRAEWASIRLKDGDVVEIVRARQGG